MILWTILIISNFRFINKARKQASDGLSKSAGKFKRYYLAFR